MEKSKNIFADFKQNLPSGIVVFLSLIHIQMCIRDRNAVVVGKIKIGNNVLIAPNAYVNFDIPDNSVVVGNPATITPNENATADYINRKVEY